jgi:hypothetical protein
LPRRLGLLLEEESATARGEGVVGEDGDGWEREEQPREQSEGAVLAGLSLMEKKKQNK